ncbi:MULTISPECIES: hypothetical protein [unclassified Flavobacterium]|uniref:hypothetical protein n=1 Tax=unclassified Flavobacterium TaxID=196869 RepID=UPI0025C08A9E|nr:MULTISPECIES: hypothetical protein [unclassified Flavobacterium]
MEKVKLFYKPETEDYFNELVFILFKEDYFSYLENAIIYKDKILNFIESNISTFPSRKTPKILQSFGTNYIFYKSNQRTTWYIFFEKSENNYLITNIINSHSKEAKWL